MDDWTKLLGGLRAERRDLADGEALFRPGDEVRALFRVERGRLRLTRDGVTLHLVRAGSTLAEASLFRPNHDSHAIAEGPCRVQSWAKAAILLYLRVHPDINLAFSACLAGTVERLRGQQEAMRLPGARDRVMAWLAQLGAADGPVTLDGGLTAAARDMGLTREALYRALAALVAEGRLERPEKRVFRLVT